MTSRQLIHWQTLHERRGRSALGSPVVVAIVAGFAIGIWVAQRHSAGGAVLGSHAWLAAAFASFAFAALRVPFLLYWRHDAAFLAQMPIEGGPLYDAALWRCIRAALGTTAALVIGAIPLVDDGDLFARHLAFAGAIGAAAGLVIPAVATYGASVVAASQGHHKAAVVRAAQQVAPPPPPTSILGALPGFAATMIVSLLATESPFLVGKYPSIDPIIGLGGLVAGGVVAIAIARARAPHFMAKVLRDVSALDRQRLATLEIRPPTKIESLVASLLGGAGLPYRKDAVMMRRRFPMAYALGAIVFLVLVIVGFAAPADPWPWLGATLAGACLYGAVLASRLKKKPIEIARLSASLPIEPGAIARAKTAWVAVWLVIFVAAPGIFALVRVVR